MTAPHTDATRPQRHWLKLAGWTALAATAALMGCGKKEEAAPAAPAAEAAPAASAEAKKAEPLKIAFAYVGPVGDGGWTFAHDNARKALEKEFGDKIVTSFVEKVPEAADAERVFRDMIGQGNTLIFGTTFGYMEPMLKTAADTPSVKFEHATGYKTAPNMRTYDSRTYEGAYMAGVIAGAMTKTNTLGVVGSIPIPEVIRNINSFTLGAQSVNPNPAEPVRKQSAVPAWRQCHHVFSHPRPIASPTLGSPRRALRAPDRSLRFESVPRHGGNWNPHESESPSASPLWLLQQLRE